MSERLDAANKARTRLFGVLSSLPAERICDHGEGVYLFDQEGKKYIDFSGSPMACCLGHGDQRITRAVTEQMQKVSLCFSTYWINEREGELAERVLRRAPQNMARCQFLNSGSEATESAIKLARQYHLENGQSEKHIVISRWQSYHGMTLGALSVTGFSSRRNKFTPLLQPWPKIGAPLCYHCPYDMVYPDCEIRCARALDGIINQVGAQYISAFIAEPIGGAASAAMVPVPEYYPLIKEICEKHDVLFIDDEVICGFGRTGKWFGIDHWGVQPDIITMAKGMTGAYTPLAAILVSDRIAGVFEQTGGKFINAFTTAGNPVSCAAGIAVVDIIETEGLVERSARLGEYLHRRAREKLSHHPVVGDIRGRGMLMGVELVKDKATREPFEPSRLAGSTVHRLAMEKGCMVFPTSGFIGGVRGDAVMMAPPYIITEAQIDTALEILDESLADFAGEMAR
ncbi:MAG: aminotransferase class III-fold pyridoxal phosphate-dependent enzyme [Dehalococcoidales bacterium]